MLYPSPLAPGKKLKFFQLLLLEVLHPQHRWSPARLHRFLWDTLQLQSQVCSGICESVVLHTWEICMYIYIYGCEIVLDFFFEQVWDFFLDFLAGTICLVFATVWNLNLSFSMVFATFGHVRLPFCMVFATFWHVHLPFCMGFPTCGHVHLPFCMVFVTPSIGLYVCGQACKSPCRSPRRSPRKRSCERHGP